MDMNKNKGWKRRDVKLVLKVTDVAECNGLMWQGTVNVAGLSVSF